MVVGLVAVVSATGGGAWSGFARAGNSELVAVVGSEVKLAPRGEIGNAMFGVAARLSADGTTALIGGSYDDHYRGAAWVFVRDGATWVQQAKLAPRGEIGGGAFGFGLCGCCPLTGTSRLSGRQMTTSGAPCGSSGASGLIGGSGAAS